MKKLIALLLCLTMALALFTACAPTEKAKTEQETMKEETKKEEPKKEEPKKEETKQEETKQEETKKDETPEEHLPLVKEGSKTLTIGIPIDSRVENYDTNDYTLWLEEQTGIDLEFVQFASGNDSKTQLSLMVSGGETLPDILWGFTSLSDTDISEYGQDGYFIDLTPYFETAYYYEDNIKGFVSPEAQTMLNDMKDATTGEIYAYPYMSEGSTKAASLVEINKVWLDKLGLEVPTSCEELYNVLVAFRDNDPNGNGQADEICFTSANSSQARALEWVINAFVYENDLYFFNVTDGKLWVPYVTDEYREAMKYLNKLYNEGLLFAQTLTFGANEIKPLMSEGTTIGCAAGYPANVFDTAQDGVFNYVAVGPLAAESDLGGYGGMICNTLNKSIYITKDCKEPQLAFDLIDFMGTLESFQRQRYGVEGLDWRYAEPGELDSKGNQATFCILDSNQYSGTNNRSWHNFKSFFKALTFTNVSNTDVTTAAGYRSWLTNEQQRLYEEVGQPAELIYRLNYNSEESEIVSTYSKFVTDYMKQARDQFVSGVLDPNSDTDWNAYVSNMEKQGMNEYLKAAQSAYDRAKK